MKKRKELLVIPLVFFCLHATTFADAAASDADFVISKCNNTEGCSTDPQIIECQKICGCDRIYKFDDSMGECVIDYDYLKERTRSSNLMHTDLDFLNDDGLAKKMRESTERVFQGIIFCAIFFVICASICVISACVFCCQIHYSDQKLKNEVKALANKLKIDYHKKESIKKMPRDQKAESCNVVVEDANIMCV